MSEHEITVVRLDLLSQDDAISLTDAVTAWLKTAGIIAGNDRYDPLWQPSQWMPGPAIDKVIEPTGWIEHFPTLANNGVDISSSRDAHHPGGNDEDPRCISCDAAAPAEYTDSYGDWLQAWLDTGNEPAFTCTRCGWSGLIGDWRGEFSIAVGAPSVTFHNWPELRATFLSKLRDRLGGRTAVVRTRI
jgi:hypothetical protein